MAKNTARQDNMKIAGKGSFRLPPGMTQQEAERLIREAEDKKNRKDS
jgi:hypothetical protein